MQKLKFFILASFFLFATAFADLPTIFPPALQKGDLIAVVYPASYLECGTERAQKVVDSKLQWLKLKGFRAISYPSKVKRKGYLAGTDAERADALMEAWKNDEVKAIWCFRGGYGTPRILDLLDYQWIKQHPKILIGMSDITALHQAIQIKAGLVTFLGPVLNLFNDKDSGLDESYAFTSLQKVLQKGSTGEIQLPVNFEIIREGKAQGKLVGGNLSLIASLCGTQWQLNSDGKILLLEDVSEKVYRIDRMLWQLKEAGLLERPAAVILASWVDCQPSSECSLNLQQVFKHYFGGATYPVIKRFPSGHDKYQYTLPLNAKVAIDTSKQSFQILETPVKK